MGICPYEKFAEDIKTFLMKAHNLSNIEADEAMKSFSLKELYSFNPEMATHSAIDTWAEDILYCWRRKKESS